MDNVLKSIIKHADDDAFKLNAMKDKSLLAQLPREMCSPSYVADKINKMRNTTIDGMPFIEDYYKFMYIFHLREKLDYIDSEKDEIIKKLFDFGICWNKNYRKKSTLSIFYYRVKEHMIYMFTGDIDYREPKFY
jgi:hypothetical protein